MFGNDSERKAVAVKQCVPEDFVAPRYEACPVEQSVESVHQDRKGSICPNEFVCACPFCLEPRGPNEFVCACPFCLEPRGASVSTNLSVPARSV